MSAKPVLIGAFVVGCLAAAAAGGYLAVRLARPEPAPPAATVPASAPNEAAPAATPAPAADTPPAATPAPTPPARTEPAVARPRPAARENAARRPAPAEPARTAAEPPAALPPVPDVELPAAVNPPLPPPPPVPVIPPDAPRTPAPVFEELTVDEETVIGIRLDAPLSSETARIEDRVSARVLRDVTVAGRTAIPAGARLEGIVSAVERGGRFRNQARLGLRFTTLILADGSRLPIETEPIFRMGESPAGEATAKVGASAVVGAILGAVIGGRRGAAIGGASGAAAGTAAVVADGPNTVVLAAGTPLTLRLTAPLTVIIERRQDG